MYTLQQIFTKVTTPQELLELLHEYEDKGVKYFHSIGFTTIDISDVISIVENLYYENTLEEIYRYIVFQLTGY